jgi:Fe-S cluster biogenesis protein NfuA
MKKDVEELINKLKPALQRDGGDIELVSVKDGVVKVRLQGACSSCPHASETLKYYVENELKSNIKGIKRVERV